MAFSTKDEEVLFKNVVDIMLLKKPEQRALGYEKLINQLKVADERLKELLEERPKEVTQTISYFTSIVQLIKQSKEKLSSLKTRLYNCKSSFSEKFDKAETAFRMYLKSKESVDLMQKISKLSECGQYIDTCISNKDFLSASNYISERIHDIDTSLTTIDAIKNWKIDFQSTIAKYYDALLQELTFLLRDKKELETDPTSIKVITDPEFMPQMPSPSNVNLLQNKYISQRDSLKMIAESVRHIKKLKETVMHVVKQIKKDVDYIIRDTTKSILEEMVEAFEIFRTQDASSKINKRLFVTFVKRLIARLDIIYDKYYFLFKCFDEEFKKYDTNAANSMEENFPFECVPELILEHSNNEINLGLINVLKYYLTDKDLLITKVEDQTSNNLDLSIMDQVFSYKRRNMEVNSKNYLFRFESSASVGGCINAGDNSENGSSNNDGWDSTIDILAKPSVKYLKGIYLPIFAFFLKHNEFYLNRSLDNPLRLFLDDYFNEVYKSCFFNKFAKIFSINTKERIEKYGNVEYNDLKSISRKRPLHKASYDFAIFMRNVMSNITVFSPNIPFFLDYFSKVGKYVYISYEATFDMITINQKGITIKGLQVISEFSETDINNFYNLSCRKYSQEKSDATNAFLNDISFSLVLSLKDINLLSDHILFDNSAQTSLISVFESLKWLSLVINELLEYCKTICSSQPFNYLPRTKILERFKPIEVPSVIRENIEDYINPKMLEKIKTLYIEILELSIKSYSIIYFDLRFRVAFHFQEIFGKIFKNDNLSTELVDSCVETIVKDLINSYNSYKKIISNKRLNFLFYNLGDFIKDYILNFVQSKTDFKLKYADFLRKCIYSLIAKLSEIKFISMGKQLMEVAEFFDLFDQTPNEIMDFLKINGPQFSLASYSAVLFILKDPAEKNEIFSDRMQLLKSYFVKARSISIAEV